MNANINKNKLISLTLVLIIALSLLIVGYVNANVDGNNSTPHQVEDSNSVTFPSAGEPDASAWSDDDKDGTPNFADNCPNEYGLVEMNGCPAGF